MEIWKKYKKTKTSWKIRGFFIFPLYFSIKGYYIRYLFHNFFIMENEVKILRWVQSYWMPFFSGIIFLFVFYASYFLSPWGELSVSSSKVLDFAGKYSVYVPLLYAIVLITLTYIVYFIIWLVRLRYFFVYFLLLLWLSVWNIFLGYQLLYFEPRYTDVAIFIIDSYAKHIFYAGIGMMFLPLVTVCIKRKA